MADSLEKDFVVAERTTRTCIFQVYTAMMHSVQVIRTVHTKVIVLSLATWPYKYLFHKTVSPVGCI